MRTLEEIERDAGRLEERLTTDRQILEVLLDIRELLRK